MLRDIMLLTPVFVTLFWALSLHFDKKSNHTPTRFLSKLMILLFIDFLAHYFYFTAYTVYPYFDIALQFISLLIFPIFHIYIRLLTVDEKFTIKKYLPYLILCLILTSVYMIGVLLTPELEYKTWLFNNDAFPDSEPIMFLKIMRRIIRTTNLLIVIITIIANYRLIKKFRDKVEECYSDFEDGKTNNVKMLDYTFIILGISIFIFKVLGRSYLLSHPDLISIGWLTFSIGLFIIGFLAMQQKPVNPTFEPETIPFIQNKDALNFPNQKEILRKLSVEFQQNKIYLNSEFNIMDIVKITGTNRTYLSLIINKQYNQNFCTFVNSFRLDELRRLYSLYPQLSNESLSEKCGFGSLNSMKRAIKSSTGMSITEWREEQLNQ